MIGIVNSGGGGSGGTLTITAPVGATITASKDGKLYTRTVNAAGLAVFRGLSTGVWTLTLTDGVQKPATRQVEVTADYSLTMAFFAAFIQVTYPAGSVCKCTKGNDVLTAVGTSGSYTFTVSEPGEWVVSCTDGSDSDSQTVSITADGEEKSVSLGYQLYASDFAFYLDENKTTPAALGTDYQIVYDDDTDIPQSEWASAKNWKIRNLVTIFCVPLEDGEIDVFCVGGGGDGGKGNAYAGGGGGAGGCTATSRKSIIKNTIYPIDVGSANGKSSGFGVEALGGGNGNNATSDAIAGSGGSGGSGGGLGGTRNKTPGEDGASDGNSASGTGQGTTTREFGESTGKLYSGGGGGGTGQLSGAVTNGGAGGSGGGGAGAHEVHGSGTAGTTNTGGGGGGGGASGAGGTGGSGIVVIRAARGGAA